ncbi:GMC oxidoreductase [Serendipita vermifera MAFF 305830]|uniref:GMC oxidoreductase n=1 Tax=Serendipita vermifera MAFF 305830 TaxID=933852 RepID=A0A0C3BIX6_SERVB|nr:GMC oxidoreductase [Serendipita vermifera MAFF 305830]
MVFLSTCKTAVLAAFFLLSNNNVNASAVHINKRSTISTNPSDLDGKAFDFVIVGGGAAGLTLAARLSEQENKKVAVIEAGDDGEAVMERILVPIRVAVPNSPNDWGYYANSLGRTLHQPRGKVLGGSTAVNALYMVRASAEEHDSWAALLPDAPADADWSWNGLYPYMQKSENFTAPVNAAAISATVNASAHGTSGPVHVSFPQFVYPATQAWTPTLAAMGLKTDDPQGGQGWGGYITPNSINPDDGTRSYAKTAYLDPASGRGNLVVLLQSQATKVTFDTSSNPPRATGIDFQQSQGGQTYHVEVISEVILSAGVFGTPHLLQLSGVGPKALIESFGISSVVDLPGVGEHFQDHVLVPLTWSAPNDTVTGDMLIQNTTFAAEQLQLFHDGQLSQSLMGAPNNGIGYVSLKRLFNNDTFTTTFIQQMKENMTAVITNQGFTDETLRKGYEATYTAEVNTLETTEIGAVELLLGSFGSWNGVNRTISMQVAIQHPMSRGSVKLNSTDPFVPPVITANYLNTDSDWAIMRAGVRYLRQVVATEPMKSLIVEELSPGAAVQSDADIDGWMYLNAATQYHPSSTSSMLPLDHGGVVDPTLKVYGTTGLRVVDASIVPIGLCAHLMGPTYAIAEKASDMIKANPTANRTPNVRSGAESIRFSWMLSAVLAAVMAVLAVEL